MFKINFSKNYFRNTIKVEVQPRPICAIRFTIEQVVFDKKNFTVFLLVDHTLDKSFEVW